VTISSKALCDSYCTNSHYAKVGGISTQEINTLELEFLKLIDWHLSTTGPILQQYYANLVDQHSCYERITSDSSKDESKRQKRRRSSAEAIMTQLPMENRVNDKQKEDLDEERIQSHFNTLLDDESIPYIA
jgi:hypothetical protein